MTSSTGSLDPLFGPIQNEIDRFEHRLNEMLQSDVAMVHDVARYMASLKGKRLRPALTILCARASGRWDDRVIDASVGVELIHAATVVHDDVVDAATTRRGKASVNAQWDDHIAVLMGDFLLARALCLLVSLGNLEALGAVSHATERLSQGEIYEMQISQQTDTEENSYFSMVGDKTASLIAAACRIGPLMTGADDKVVEGLTRYGEYLGLAFQIADDILDFTSDALTLGKPVGHDLREGKITLPLIRALKVAPNIDSAGIVELLKKQDAGESDWQQIFDFVHQHGGVTAASATAHDYAAKARECLEVVEPSVARSILETAVRLVVERHN